MMGLLALAFGTAFGIAAWKNAAPAVQPNGAAAAVLVAGAMLLAYLAGRRGRGGNATAVAVASAEATAIAQGGAAAVNLTLVTPEAWAERARVAPGWDAMPWQPAVGFGAQQQQLPESDELDGLDPVEVLDAIADDRVAELREADEA